MTPLQAQVLNRSIAAPRQTGRRFSHLLLLVERNSRLDATMSHLKSSLPYETQATCRCPASLPPASGADDAHPSGDRRRQVSQRHHGSRLSLSSITHAGCAALPPRSPDPAPLTRIPPPRYRARPRLGNGEAFGDAPQRGALDRMGGRHTAAREHRASQMFRAPHPKRCHAPRSKTLVRQRLGPVLSLDCHPRILAGALPKTIFKNRERFTGVHVLRFTFPPSAPTL